MVGKYQPHLTRAVAQSFENGRGATRPDRVSHEKLCRVGELTLAALGS